MKGLSPEELIGVVAFLNAVGYAVKQSPVRNWLIPYILAGIGAVFCPLLGDASSVKDIAWLAIIGVTQGMAAVGVNQAFRQATEGRLDDSGKPQPPKTP